jgi:DNA-binding NarL/FixJ family response regulator
MARIGILIADDHAVVREGLARIIGDQPDMRVLAQVADGEAALRAAGATDPHVTVLDMRMPGLGGVAAIRQLRECCPRTRILGLSMYEDASYARAALAAGAHAYLGKSASPEVLLRCIRQLHAGEVLSGMEPSGAEAGTTSLSPREREIMDMVALGQTSRQMASALGISKSSIDTYRARVFRKLGLESRADLVARLSRRGESP